jgi:hypothetical protein
LCFHPSKINYINKNDNDSVIKHIHTFRALLEQLSVIGSLVDDEVIVSLMRSVPIGYKTFINSLRQQPHLTLSSLIIDLIQERTLMKNVNTTNDCPIALFRTKKFY